MPKERKQVDCPYCGRTFAHQGALNLHLPKCPKNQGGGRESDHVCPVCGSAFRALNPKVREERIALGMDFEEVCVKCQELI